MGLGWVHGGLAFRALTSTLRRTCMPLRALRQLVRVDTVLPAASKKAALAVWICKLDGKLLLPNEPLSVLSLSSSHLGFAFSQPFNCVVARGSARSIDGVPVGSSALRSGENKFVSRAACALARPLRLFVI